MVVSYRVHIWSSLPPVHVTQHITLTYHHVYTNTFPVCKNIKLYTNNLNSKNMTETSKNILETV